MRFRCPVCGNESDIRRGKINLPPDANDREVNAYDFYCWKCKTLESERDDAPEFEAFYRRWLVPLRIDCSFVERWVRVAEERWCV